MYIIHTFIDTFPWEKGENVLGPIQKIRRTGEGVKKKKKKLLNKKLRPVRNLAPCPQLMQKKVKLINKNIISPLLHSLRASSGEADVAELIQRNKEGECCVTTFTAVTRKTKEGGCVSVAQLWAAVTTKNTRMSNRSANTKLV